MREVEVVKFTISLEGSRQRQLLHAKVSHSARRQLVSDAELQQLAEVIVDAMGIPGLSVDDVSVEQTSGTTLEVSILSRPAADESSGGSSGGSSVGSTAVAIPIITPDVISSAVSSSSFQASITSDPRLSETSIVVADVGAPTVVVTAEIVMAPSPPPPQSPPSPPPPFMPAQMIDSRTMVAADANAASGTGDAGELVGLTLGTMVGVLFFCFLPFGVCLLALYLRRTRGGRKINPKNLTGVFDAVMIDAATQMDVPLDELDAELQADSYSRSPAGNTACDCSSPAVTTGVRSRSTLAPQPSPSPRAGAPVDGEAEGDVRVALSL